MEVNQISQLAAILRENGDQVLNSVSKFALSATLLCNLNNSFASVIEQRDSINSTFQVINSSNVKAEIYRDLQFLHDFVQRTVSLKLTPTLFANPSSEIVDISKFKNLKLLELNKVNVNTTAGLQTLRTQLQYLICIRSIDSLSDLLEKCGADDTQGFIWCELKEASFCHNKLTQIDSSLEFVPWLNTLDLSHNHIRDARPLSCLPNLKHLNLSYNHLESFPLFTGQLCNRLQVLILGNNFIEDIRELTGLVNLCELDLSDNCLLEHEALAAVAHLAALQLLNVQGNPLSFHPQHRTRTARFLHVNTATVRFVLDKVLLNKAEKRLVGSLHLIHSTLQRSHLSSFCSTVSEGTLVASERPRRVRNATISDTNQDSNMESSYASVASLITSGEHLETKQKIEQLRKEYGETWLHSQGGGSLVHDVLGLEKTSLPMSSSPYEKEFLLHAKEVDIRSKDKSEINSEKSTNNTFTTATESIASENNSLYAGEQIASPEPPPSDDEDLGEGEESLYLATIKDETEPVFIVLTNTHIWERECNSGKEKARWPLETLQSCELLGDNCTEVRLGFDTVKRDRQERQYELEVDEATRLACVLNNILTNRPPEECKLVVYRCMKCSTQFSNEKKRGRETPALKCPACQSTVVIEDDEP
ncbi:hypothetical protein ILUMI_20639 [Ignelater luminosus]|uniref:Serine/threonine-protein kinase 11-interacting protein n=1 Tax=Ignelater luminosus TaxID=2038154 RepID=A0A8K0CDV4_IGNLU|nr:hypothetical protein ILUMI_20639 [Ignelater luminosus]